MLKIGNIEITNQVFLAPMSGVTDAAFRKLAAELGAGMVVSEMIASESLVKSQKDELRKAKDYEAPGVKVIQLAGREAKWMAQGAKIARDLGADIIDINMGCPAKQVTNGASGAALMRDLDHALRLIEATVGAVDAPVTLKMRLGWDETSLNAPDLAKRAESAGVQMITVHGRTRAQFYKSHANWAAIGDVKRAVDIPVIANGDLTEITHAHDMLKISGADGVMIGRGAYGAPWFPGQVAASFNKEPYKEIEPDQQGEIARRHYQDMMHVYGRALGVRCARKHLAWYIEKALGVVPQDAQARAWRSKMCTLDDPIQVLDQLSRFYDVVGERRAS